MLGLVSIQASVVNYLTNKNTTTVDKLSYLLQKKVKVIRAVQPGEGLTNAEFPAVFVSISNVEEKPDILGSTNNRIADFSVNIYPYTQAGMATFDASITAYKEIVQLTQNINHLIRENYNLSTTGLWQRGMNTDVDYSQDDSTTYIRGSKIEVECSKLTT